MTNTHSTLAWFDDISCDIYERDNNDRFWNDDEDIQLDKELMELEMLDKLFGYSKDSEEATKARRQRWLHIRLNWTLHVKKLLHENEFQRTYGMTISSFNRLVILLTPYITRHTCKSRCPQPISVECIIAVALRYLRNGSMSDIKNVYGMCRSETYNCRDCFIDGVIQCDYLQICMPETAEEWEEIKKGFQSKSSNNFINGCVGAIDGYLQQMKAPKSSEVGLNIEAYFSGHYLCYGLNCQAACTSELKFIYFGVVAPGKTNDNVAVDRTNGLMEVIKNLPHGLFFVGDAAYTIMEHLLIPYTGDLTNDKDKDTYNFYISQMRIRIEMAFGMLVKRFGILATEMKTSVKNTSKILIACASLHNFLIDERAIRMNSKNWLGEQEDNNKNGALEGNSNLARVRMTPHGMQYLPTIPQDDFEIIPGHSQIRQAILEVIKENKMRRPLYNIKRNMNRKKESINGYGQEYFHLT